MHLIYRQEAYLEPCQISNMERVVNIVNSGQPLTIFAKCPKISQDSEYTPLQPAIKTEQILTK